jgi:hypothetical protein
MIPDRLSDAIPVVIRNPEFRMRERARAAVSDRQHNLALILSSMVVMPSLASRGFRLAAGMRGRQTHLMKRPPTEQGHLFASSPANLPVRRHQPPRQTIVSISAEAIAAVTAGAIDGQRLLAAAIRGVRPDVRNVAVDLGTIRWTDPGTGRRVIFATPVVVRAALFALAGGATPAPFRFTLGRAVGAAPPVRPAGLPTA